MKKSIYIIVSLLILIGLAYLFTNLKQADKNINTLDISDSYKNSTYTIDGEEVTLGNGTDGTAVYFGNEISKDLDNDGKTDIAFLITKNNGGSGTFFYVVGALQKTDEYGDTYYLGSEAVFLGDRIAPQTTESGPGTSIIVNYADRATNEPMTAEPSVGKTLRLILDAETMQFGQVANNFEGEADPSRMSLDMKTWVWQEALYNDDSVITPKNPGVFTLTFKEESMNGGTFSATTDCNNVSGAYTLDDNKITFENMISTLKFCADSQESEFTSMLTNSTSYFFTSKGELILEIKYDSGVVIFK